jgi:hypothetical protein
LELHGQSQIMGEHRFPMKTTQFALLACLAGTSQVSAALDSLTIDGVTYRNVTLKKEYPLSVFVKHEEGTTFIERKKLGQEQLEQLSGGSSNDSDPSLGGNEPDSEDVSLPPSAFTEPQTETFEIDVAGAKAEVTRMGDGPVGVIFFGNSDSQGMRDTILRAPRWFSDLVPDKCSFFLWAYPDTAPFDQVQPAISAYMEGDKDKMRPQFKGIASNVLAQIREKTGLKEWLLVGNSLGAGIILWDYKELEADPKTAFLFVSPTETFMPPVSGLGKLERSMLLAAKGWKNDDEQMRTDRFLTGEEAWDWVASNLDMQAVDKITESRASEPEEIISKPGEPKAVMSKRTDFDAGHKIIGQHINNELLGKIIKVKLGMADYGILAEPPQQTD